MTDDLTTFCHHVVWYHEPLTLYAHLNGREVVYLADAIGDDAGLPAEAQFVQYVCQHCIAALPGTFWEFGLAIDRPALPAMYGPSCYQCNHDIPEMYQLERRGK